MIITTIENSWVLTKTKTPKYAIWAQWKANEQTQIKDNASVRLYIVGNLVWLKNPPQVSPCSLPPHLSQRPAGGRWRGGPLCQEGSSHHRWRCRCHWTPGSWSIWSHRGGWGSPQTPAYPWMGPCCQHRGHHRCSGKSVGQRGWCTVYERSATTMTCIYSVVAIVNESILHIFVLYVEAHSLLHPVIAKVEDHNRNLQVCMALSSEVLLHL